MNEPINDRDLRLAAMAIITYVGITQTGSPPKIGDDGIIEAGAYLDNEVFEQTLEIISMGDIDQIEMYEVDDEEDEDEP